MKEDGSGRTSCSSLEKTNNFYIVQKETLKKLYVYCFSTVIYVGLIGSKIVPIYRSTQVAWLIGYGAGSVWSLIFPDPDPEQFMDPDPRSTVRKILLEQKKEPQFCKESFFGLFSLFGGLLYNVPI